MPQDFQELLPQIPPAPIPTPFQPYLLALEFRREVEERQRHEDYCQWYERLATQHQQEWRAMQSDINLLRWFTGRST